MKNIQFDYDLKLFLMKREISFLNTKININVICDFEYSIRPCSFKNLLYLINVNVPDGKRDKDYKIMMETIKQNKVSLVDIIDRKYDIKLTTNSYYWNFINHLRKFVSENSMGVNIIRFLLLDMRNNVIKAQMYRPKGNMPKTNNEFNNLRIHLGTKSFELMPFTFNPKEAKPSIYTLLDLFEVSNRGDELLYRHIVDHINQYNTLFIKSKDINYSEEKF